MSVALPADVDELQSRASSLTELVRGVPEKLYASLADRCGVNKGFFLSMDMLAGLCPTIINCANLMGYTVSLAKPSREDFPDCKNKEDHEAAFDAKYAQTLRLLADVGTGADAAQRKIEQCETDRRARASFNNSGASVDSVDLRGCLRPVEVQQLIAAITSFHYGIGNMILQHMSESYCTTAKTLGDLVRELGTAVGAFIEKPMSKESDDALRDVVSMERFTALGRVWSFMRGFAAFLRKQQPVMSSSMFGNSEDEILKDLNAPVTQAITTVAACVAFLNGTEKKRKVLCENVYQKIPSNVFLEPAIKQRLDLARKGNLEPVMPALSDLSRAA